MGPRKSVGPSACCIWMESHGHPGALRSNEPGIHEHAAREKTHRTVPLWQTMVFMDPGLGPFGPPRNDTTVPYKVSML
ncbi:hypothetical protein CHELA40_14934 [Chelatococcus asaccharovorans]|nr:hypothetical protein CHELA17_60688 [Chelatococcus asaccharovorans]CAH1680851.1 hypothetical protein CHELA40_14934 [Chelatococcus asaccharovorans]